MNPAHFGFQQNDMGEWLFQGDCRITLYSCCAGWDLDIRFPNGRAFGVTAEWEKWNSGKGQAQSDTPRPTLELLT